MTEEIGLTGINVESSYHSIGDVILAHISIKGIPADPGYDWESWLRKQLAGICTTMMTCDITILDDEDCPVTIHTYLMDLNSRWREKIHAATVQLSTTFGKSNLYGLN